MPRPPWALLVAPLPWGQIADRWVPAELCISVCTFFCGVLLWVLGELTTPVPIFLVALGFWFFMIPVLSLGTALTFRHLQHPERDFGPVRMWGTIGWVSVNWSLSCWFAEPDFLQDILAALRPGNPFSELADAFRLGGSLAFLLSAYAWTLPHSPPSKPGSLVQPGEELRTLDGSDLPLRGSLQSYRRWARSAFDAPLMATRLFRQRSFLIYCVCLTGFYVTMPFTTQLTPLLLEKLGVTKTWLPAVLTLAQSSEVATLGLLPLIMLRLEIKGTMLVGVVAWTGALVILTVGQPTWLTISSLALNGMFITCYLVAGQVFVNRRAAKDIRASAQALLQFLNGIGLLMGNLLVGRHSFL